MDVSHPSPICSAVIVASGGSRRMGFDKLTSTLAGASVLERSIRVFASCPWIGEIILVCPQQRWEQVGGSPPDAIRFTRVDGGAERQDSVLCGLAAASLPMACVHDAARPLVALADLDRCIAEAMRHGAATLAHRMVDTLCRGDESGFATEGVDRTHVWAMETPQCAPASVLRDALQAACEAGKTVTDETSALIFSGIPVKFVESAFPNPKITTPADLKWAEALLS